MLTFEHTNGKFHLAQSTLGLVVLLNDVASSQLLDLYGT